jgi:KDO2-lipid IV(A) lauroyltransferase
MADSTHTTHAPPIRWLFARQERRQRALRYWVRDTAMGVLNTTLHQGLKALPIDACSAFGATASALSPKRYPASDARARANWRRLRPEQSDPASVDAAMRRRWRCIGRTMAEFSVLDRLWAAGRIAVEGSEHLDALRAANRPILNVWVHLGNWETIGVTCFAVGHPGAGLYLPPENRFDHRIAVKVREHYGAKIFPPGPKAMRAAVRCLTERKLLYVILIDETIDDRVSAPAFGRELRTDGNIAFAARLAWLTNAAIVPAYCVRLDDRAQFKVTYAPPVDLIRDGDRDAALVANIHRINAVIEPIVRAHLDQWYFLLDLEFDAQDIQSQS